MAVIDTSFLISAWNEDHPKHREARKRLARGSTLRVNAGALSEASRVIRRLSKDLGLDGNAEARAFLDTFLRLPGASIETSCAFDAWPRYLAQGKLSYVDAWVLEQADHFKEPAWSYDKALG